MNRIESICNKLGNQLVGVTKRVREELGFLRIKKGYRERESIVSFTWSMFVPRSESVESLCPCESEE